MTFNKRYDRFTLSCNFRHSTERLLRWILRRAKRGAVDEIEIDLRVFNRFIERDRGKPYDRKTIKEALWQLDQSSKGLVLVTKSYTWAIHKILVRSLEMVLENQSQIGESSPKLNRGNPMFSEAHKQRLAQQQQQDISRLDCLLKAVKIKFDFDALRRIWTLADKKIENVKTALKLLLHRHSTQKEKITNPQGWLLECLKYNWHEGFSVYYQAELPYFRYGEDLDNFVDGVLSG